ncbi:MAG: hypothetical protein GEU90_12155 [Gemmatimonas sp.]|nr:hypothetical protein [Gemmatimonas sp.]
MGARDSKRCDLGQAVVETSDQTYSRQADQLLERQPVGISIKNEEVEAAVRELAALTNKGVTEAVDEAVRAALARIKEGREGRARHRQASWEAALAELGPFGPIDQQAVGMEMYDEHGLPR